MPFVKYQVQPTEITANKVPETELASNTLESISNSTLVNLIKQISSLSEHAVSLFDDLGREALRINERSLNLNKRIESLKTHVNIKLNVDNEVEQNEQNLDEKFIREINLDKKLFKKSEMPKFLQELYEKAEPAPQLELFDNFREDGKSTLKFYSDPDFYLRKGYSRFKKQIQETLSQNANKDENSNASSKILNEQSSVLNTSFSNRDLPIAYQLTKLNQSSNQNDVIKTIEKDSSSLAEKHNQISTKIEPSLLKTFDNRPKRNSTRKSFYEEIQSGKNLKQIQKPQLNDNENEKNNTNDISDDSFTFNLNENSDQLEQNEDSDF